MKRILVNMNRSGYFWHELDNTALSDKSVVKMKREISEDSHPAIASMRTYEQFNYIFMQGNGDYILAIRNLNDPRVDGSGRNLKQHVIFEDEDKDLLLKMLAYYLTWPEDFETWITSECFKPGQNDALCKMEPFNKKIEEIKKAQLNPILETCDFAISSLKSAEWLQEKFRIKGINVAEYLNKLDTLKGTKLISFEPSPKPTIEQQLQSTINQLMDEKQQLTDEKQHLQLQLESVRTELKKWKLYAGLLAVIAGGVVLWSILIH